MYPIEKRREMGSIFNFTGDSIEEREPEDN